MTSRYSFHFLVAFAAAWLAKCDATPPSRQVPPSFMRIMKGTERMRMARGKAGPRKASKERGITAERCSYGIYHPDSPPLTMSQAIQAIRLLMIRVASSSLASYPGPPLKPLLARHREPSALPNICPGAALMPRRNRIFALDNTAQLPLHGLG